MIAINNLDYCIGDRPIYKQASLHIKPKDKIGLIGLNGTGKSTLLKIINSELTIDGGEVSKSGNCSIGYLNQDLLSFQSDDSILEVTMNAFGDVVKIEKEIEHLIKDIEDNYSEDKVHQLGKLQEKYDAADGYTLQSKAEEILEGVGFKTDDLHRPLKEFSGGWRMRVMLAKLLLEKPSLLMLDEPTNHLDLPSIQWIEEYLQNYEGAFIVVSHDRTFLNNTVNVIVEVNNANLIIYNGNYDNYEDEKEERNEVLKNAYLNQQQKIKQTEKFIERFRAKATKARQVQSKIKSLERMDQIEMLPEETVNLNMRFSVNKQPGRFVVKLSEINKSYGPIKILENAEANIERGSKIALIGANGKGKSTLLRIIAKTEPFQGNCELGHNVEASFYAQHQLEDLNIENEILEELTQNIPNKSELEIRNLLGCFMFSNDDVFKKIKVLSGGEKSRVALAKVLATESNFLMLDEPTNHLDMLSVKILAEALKNYEGTFILVSHDRQFISEVANKIWYIENNQIKEYPGTYHEYCYWMENRKNTPEVVPQKTLPTKEDAQDSPKEKKAQLDYQQNKEKQKRLRTLHNKLKKIEQDIEGTESKISEIESGLASPENFSNPDKLQGLNDEYSKNKSLLEGLNNEWEKLVIQIDEEENEA